MISQFIYGHTKIKLSNKLAEMKYLYKSNRNCNKFKSVFDRYGSDNLIIGLVDVISLSDIDEVNKKIKELTQHNINNSQPTEPTQKQPTEQIQMQSIEQPNITYTKTKTNEQRAFINANTPKKSFADIIKQIGSN